MDRIRVIWHRRDLRLTDNALYNVGPETRVVSIYIFDPQDFTPKRSCSDANHMVARMGPFAARFLLESVQALRESLKVLGIDLLIRSGEPRQVVPAFLHSLLSDGHHGQIEVVWHDEAGTSEAAEAAAVRAAVCELDQQSPGGVSLSCLSFWGRTMWHPLDLANTVYRPSQSHCESQEVDTSPAAWSQIKQQGVQSFRRKAKACHIRSPTPPPASLLPLRVSNVPLSNVPSLTDLIEPADLFGFTTEEVSQIIVAAQGPFNPRSAHPFFGGEAAGLQHLQTFVRGPAAFCDREGGGGADGDVDCSAKMSAYLAFGCISPRTVLAVCQARKDGKAMWLPENMEMQDFWTFYALAHGRHLFKRDGDGSANLPANHWRPHNPTVWRRWLLGGTGFPLLDAAMKELSATGYTSNRCRQIPVSVLTNDLALDWRSGAELYQWLLVDHDVAANWGNWRYFGGVGCDPKRRQYKVLSQGLRYDAEAAFIKKWLPGLQDLDAKEAHLIPIRRARSLAGDCIEWPEPIVDALKHVNWDDMKNLERGSGRDCRQSRAPNCKAKGKGRVASGGDSQGNQRSRMGQTHEREELGYPAATSGEKGVQYGIGSEDNFQGRNDSNRVVAPTHSANPARRWGPKLKASEP